MTREPGSSTVAPCVAVAFVLPAHAAKENLTTVSASD